MSTHEQNAVVVKDLYKSFRLPHEQSSGIKELILNIFRRTKKQNKRYETQHVLKDISFEIKKGEFFGIVGRNGSGKSTLLKLLAGIYAPDEGLVRVNGSLTPFIELGVGFNPELTGRENVYLNGALLGFSRSEMDTMYASIVEFAELDRFMDQKLKNYSSGMQVRLAFSIAIRAQSDILLIDEVLAVGDSAFQEKCFDYFKRIKAEQKTIILVTHDMSAVEKFCDRALLIEGGGVKKIGDPYQIASDYATLNQDSIEKNKGKDVLQDIGKDGKIVHSRLLEGETAINASRRIRLQIKTKSLIDENVIIGVSIVRRDNTYIAGQNSINQQLHLTRGTHTVECEINLGALMKGSYFVNTSLYTEDFKLLDFLPNKAHFTLKENTAVDKDGIINLPVTWVYNDES